MKLFMALALLSALAGRIWFQWFDDGRWTIGDFIVLGIEAAGYLGMIASIFFLEC